MQVVELAHVAVHAAVQADARARIQELRREHARERVEVGVRVRQDQRLDWDLGGHGVRSASAPRHRRRGRSGYDCASRSAARGGSHGRRGWLRGAGLHARDENGEEVTLSSLRGRNVVLVFFPAAFSRICTKELHDVTELGRAGTTPRARRCSASRVDSPYALKAFKRDEEHRGQAAVGLPPKGEVAEQYDAYIPEAGVATRATYVIDKDGKVALQGRSTTPARCATRRRSSRRWPPARSRATEQRSSTSSAAGRPGRRATSRRRGRGRPRRTS